MKGLTVKPSLDTAFTRTFLFSIVLTLIIVSIVWGVFRYLAAQPMAYYQAQSMVAKYLLVEQNFHSPTKELTFHYLLVSQPEPRNELQFYWQKVKEEIQRSLPQGIQITHNEQGEEIYLWLESVNSPGHWIGLQLSQKRSLFPYYGWSYVLAVLILSSVPSYIFARTLSLPFAKLSDAAEVIAGGGIPKIEPRYWPLEAKKLADTLNISALKLKDQTASKEEMLLGISHDLRTPLTRTRLAVDFLHKHEPPLVEGVFADIDEMNLIIDQFISFVREGKAEKIELVDVNELVRAESEKFNDIKLKLTAAFEAPISPVSLRRMLSNLISNAIRHGIPPIEIYTENDGVGWSITVVDMGKGIPEDLIEEMIKPFRTAEVTGTNGKGGLGLAIVDRIVGNQGGKLEFGHHGNKGFAVKVSFSNRA